MKPIKFAAFLFYRYYSGGRRPDKTPYFRTVCSMTMLAFIHLIQILFLFGKAHFLSTVFYDSKIPRMIVLLLILVPLYLLLSFMIKKNELERMKEEYSYNWDKVFNWNVWLIIYITLSILLTIVIAFWKK